MVTTMPNDNRQDSGPPPGSSSNIEVLAAIARVDNRVHEVSNNQKDLNIKVSNLTGKIDAQRQAHDQLTSSLSEVKSEIKDVKIIAEQARKEAQEARGDALEAKKRVSDTQQGFNATLAAVHTSQNMVAAKAEEVDKKTTAIATETTAQTATLTQVVRTNAVQTEMIKNAQSKLAQWVILAGIAGTVLGKFIDALMVAISSVHH
jgi:chromosome segregation ATPase